MDKLEYFIHFFGYASSENAVEGETHKFDFYDYKGKASQKSLDAYFKFKEVNKKMLQNRLKQKKKGEIPSIAINQGNEGISMLKTKEFVHFGSLLPHINIKE